MKGKATINVTHKLETLKDYHQIILLQSGEVI